MAKVKVGQTTTPPEKVADLQMGNILSDVRTAGAGPQLTEAERMVELLYQQQHKDGPPLHSPGRLAAPALKRAAKGTNQNQRAMMRLMSLGDELEEDIIKKRTQMQKKK